MNPEIRLTSEDLWTSALVISLIDVVFISLLAWRIKKESFVRAKWFLIGVATAFWCGMGVSLMLVFWDTYYRYFYPGWMRAGGILLITLPIGILFSYVFYWLALRLRGNPVTTFCLLGGFQSIPAHIWGIYGFGILKIPLLQGVSPLSILAFAFPEYIFYWGIVLAVSALLQRAWRSWVRKGGI